MILANAAHALVGATMSRLPFAVAQVQDLGLIFLNVMTSNIATRLQGRPQEVVLGTAVITSALATMLLGAALILVGKCALLHCCCSVLCWNIECHRRHFHAPTDAERYTQHLCSSCRCSHVASAAAAHAQHAWLRAGRG
jgi:hypothetical protein